MRRLEAKELEQAPPLLAPEGWTFEVAELERLRGLGGAVGAFDGETLVGFLTFLELPPVRWVGNVVVASSARGAGVGAKLVEEAVRDAPRVGLYSVEKAVKLYERAGFVAKGEAWSLRAESATPKRRITSARPMHGDDGPQIARLDVEASGMERHRLLAKLIEAYPEHVRVVRERNRVVGYGLAKPSMGVTELGPIVATTPDARGAILDDLLRSASGPYEAAVLGESAEAIEALEARGFQKRFRVVPMFKGEPPAWRPRSLVTVAGLEKG